MEHSYSKDVLPKDNVEVMATRTILIPRPPQCPSCHHTSSNDDKMDHNTTDTILDQLPPAINDNIAKMAMEETERLTKTMKNANAEDEDWDLKINKFGWSKQQQNIYDLITKILDYDQLARLAVHGRPNEGILRRCSVDKSVARMRAALGTVHWNVQLSQWIHGLLVDNIPPNYMASYLDILQAMRAKVPTLVDKMISGRPMNLNQDYLQIVMKKPWGANVPTKSRKLPGQSPVIIIIPSSFTSQSNLPSSRLKRWYSLLNTMANVVPIQYTVRPGQPLESISEQVVGIARAKIQELRSDLPKRHIILVGINSGASLALQVALVETVSSIVCMGFAYNTFMGVRGAPDDKILEITTPILFVLGENSARSSQEEIESLREKMSAQTSLVVVGSVDDALRISKFSRRIEGVTQSMVDNMIADEIQDFASTCIVNPPAPRDVYNHLNKKIAVNSGKTKTSKKRKITDENKDKIPRKVGRPRLIRPNEMPMGKFQPERPRPTSALLKQSNEQLKQAIQNILPENEQQQPVSQEEVKAASEIMIPSEATVINTNELQNAGLVPPYEIVSSAEGNVPALQTFQSVPNPTAATIVSSSVTPSTTPVKLVPAKGQFVHLKPPTGAGIVQSPSVQNFFVRKGTEKKVTGQPFYTVRTQPINASNTTVSVPATSQIAPGKKIIVKSQQIISPATNVPTTNLKKMTTVSGQTITTIPATVDQTATASDLTSILDLPIIFADNEGNIQEASSASAIITSPIAQVQIPSTADGSAVTSTPSSSNFILTTSDGKIPNRQVVISAANVSKITSKQQPYQPTNKVIFINRSQIKASSATISSAPTIQTAKQMPPLKLVSSTTPIVSAGSQQNTFTKLAPGTKIDLSTLKIIKTSSPAAPSNLITSKPVLFNVDSKMKKAPGTMTIGSNLITTKPLLFNVDSTKTTSSSSRSTIVIKPKGEVSASGTGQQVLKSGLLNRNITVRKVVNIVPNKMPTLAVSSTNEIITATVSKGEIGQSSQASSPIKTLEKDKN